MERADPITEGLGAEKSTAAVRSKSESIAAAPDQPGAAMADPFRVRDDQIPGNLDSL